MYVIRSKSGDLLYTGVAIDPDRRLHQHNHTKEGAKSTRRGRPWKVVHLEGPMPQGDALRRERAIKSMTKAQKEALCEGGTP